MKFRPAATLVALSFAHPSAMQPAFAEGSFPIGEMLDTTPTADALLGEWWTEGKEGRVKVVKTSKGLYEVVLLDGKDVDKKDENNPEPKLRERKLRGIVLMWNLRFDGEEYVDGYCYNPRDGETYRVKMKITGPTTLRLRGYLAVPLLGQSQDWTRAN